MLKVAALDLRRQLIIASLHVQNVMFLFEVRASGDRLKKLELCFYNNLFSTCTRAKSYTIPWVDLLSMFVKRICEPVLLGTRVDKHFTDKCQSVDITTASDLHTNTAGPGSAGWRERCLDRRIESFITLAGWRNML